MESDSKKTVSAKPESNFLGQYLRRKDKELLKSVFSIILNEVNCLRGGGGIWLCTQRSRKYRRPESNAATTKRTKTVLTIAGFQAKIHEPLGPTR